MKHITHLALVLLLFAGIPAMAQSAWTPPGPAVGANFTEPLALKDQSGKPQTLKALLGPKGAAVFFVRSADWCPFCKRQLVEINARLAEFKKLGLNVISVSHDEVGKIAEFHMSQNIGYTMLADPDGSVVEKLGIRNTEYADGSKAFGVARPMIFIINPALKVTHKYAEQSYRDRPDLNKVLAELSVI